MLINERTKIAALLKHHPDALETIVKLSPDFKKLRNPLLRALMGGRTTIAMASKIGGCQPEDFFKALAPLGFEKEYPQTDDTENSILNPGPKPAYLQHIRPDQLVSFDVREMLAKGNDPLKAIQQKIKSLLPGEVLVIINNFEPVPLIKLLERQGFKSYVNPIDTDTIETFFYKLAADDKPVAEVRVEKENQTVSGDWQTLLKQYEGNMVEVDVRQLEMPMPMMTILENLDTLHSDKALYVNHKRIPVFLLEELKERGFDYRIKEVRDDEVYLLIFRNK